MKTGLIAVTLGCLLAAARAADDTPKEFRIREPEPHVGSHIRQSAVTSHRLPINRRYHELNDAEKAALHAAYEHIAPGDEPPFPAKGLKEVFDAMRRVQERFATHGTLRLVADVGADGKVTNVAAYGTVDPEVAKLAAQILFLIKFKPAVCSGRPCKMQYPMDFDFSLR